MRFTASATSEMPKSRNVVASSRWTSVVENTELRIAGRTISTPPSDTTSSCADTLTQHAAKEKVNKKHFRILPREFETINANRQVFWLVTGNKRLPKIIRIGKTNDGFAKNA